MDIDMDFECRECGWVFTRSFLQLEHGRVLSCQFCSGTALSIRAEFATDGTIQESVVERSMVERISLDSKIKL